MVSSIPHSQSPVAHPAKTVLLVGTLKDDLLVLPELLRNRGYRVRTTTGGLDALAAVLQDGAQAIVLCSTLPDLAQAQFCRLFKGHPALLSIPLIVVQEPFQLNQAMQPASPWRTADVDVLTAPQAQTIVHHLDDMLTIYRPVNLSLANAEPLKLAVTHDEKTLATGGLSCFLAEQLSQHLSQVNALEMFRKLTDAHYSTQAALGLLFGLLENLLPFVVAGVYLHEPGQSKSVLYFHTPEGEQRNQTLFEQLHQLVVDQLSQLTLTQPLRPDDLQWEAYYTYSLAPPTEVTTAASFKPQRVWLINVVENGELFGAYLFYWPEEEPPQESMALSLYQLQQEMHHFIQFRYMLRLQQLRDDRDASTQLLSYAGFMKQLEREWRRTERYESPLTLMVMQLVDNTRMIERYGSELVYAVGRLVSYHAQRYFRQTDFLGRLGPCEFAFLLPETEAEEAETPYQRLIEELARVPLILRGEQVNLQFEAAKASYEPLRDVNCWDFVQRIKTQLSPDTQATPLQQ